MVQITLPKHIQQKFLEALSLGFKKKKSMKNTTSALFLTERAQGNTHMATVASCCGHLSSHKATWPAWQGSLRDASHQQHSLRHNPEELH